MPLRGAVMILFFVISVPICFFRPFYGVAMWTIVAFLNPQSYIWSAAQAIPWAQTVAIPTMLGLFAFAKHWPQRLFTRDIFAVVILWSWFTITTVASTNTGEFFHHASDTWDTWTFVSKILIMSLVMICVIDSFERLRKFVLVIACCFGFYVAKSVPFLIASGGAHRLYGPEHSMIGDNNDFGLAMNMTLPLFLFLAQTESRLALRRIFGILFLMTIPVICFTYSRGALIGLLVVLTFTCLRLKQRVILIPALVVCLLIALMFAPATWKARMDPNQKLDNSALERLNAWAFARNLAGEYPITGGGFSTFTPELFLKYAPNGEDIHGPHSVYFQVLGEHGYVGLFLYLGLIVSCFANARAVVKLSAWMGDPILGQYAEMFRLSLMAFMTSGLFLGRAYFDYYFTIVVCLIVLKRIAQRQASAVNFEEAGASGASEESEEFLPRLEDPSGVGLSYRTF